MRLSIVTTITGDKFGHIVKSGPTSRGYVKRLFNIPPEHLAVLQAQSAITGGTISVNELVRRAIRMYITCGFLYKPIYMGLVKP